MTSQERAIELWKRLDARDEDDPHSLPIAYPNDYGAAIYLTMSAIEDAVRAEREVCAEMARAAVLSRGQPGMMQSGPQ